MSSCWLGLTQMLIRVPDTLWQPTSKHTLTFTEISRHSPPALFSFSCWDFNLLDCSLLDLSPSLSPHPIWHQTFFATDVLIYGWYAKARVSFKELLLTMGQSGGREMYFIFFYMKGQRRQEYFSRQVSDCILLASSSLANICTLSPSIQFWATDCSACGRDS